MSDRIQVSYDDLLNQMVRALADHFDLPTNQANQRVDECIADTLTDVEEMVRTGIIRGHPLVPIVEEALKDIEIHSQAIDLLGGTRAVLPHVRHIDEVISTLQFLVSKPARYNEFRWRWDNFKIAHAIRNRILNLKRSLGPYITKWVADNLANLKEVSSKFTGDETKDRLAWQKFSSWLTPITLRDIYTSLDRLQYYLSQSYDWDSHSVHFSPIADSIVKMHPKYGTYLEFSQSSARKNIFKICDIMQPLMVDPEILRIAHGRLVLLELYRMCRHKPDYMLGLAKSDERIRQLIAELIRSPQDRNRLILVLLGAEPSDPLLIACAPNNDKQETPDN